ncbi:MAG TPA: hypothetical protein VHO69_18225 [Phototrophicaceae bacterium]|nr:hypothetical protein [Phototrophicaceae bacterium]
MAPKTNAEYYCVCVRRDYETVWRFVTKHDTREQAEAELQARRAFTGAFNYDNAELRVISRSEAKAEFGASWEYKPIGGPVKPVKATRARQRE